MIRAVVLLLGLLLAACPAQGGLVVTFQRTGTGVDLPIVTFAVLGPDVVTGIRIDTLDPNVQFDYFQEQSRSGSFLVSSLVPDAVNGSAAAQILSLGFVDFTDGDRLTGKVDVDRRVGSDTVDWQTVLFNNGAAPNAVLSVDWSAGRTSSLVFHDEGGRDPRAPYVLTLSAPPLHPSTVPEPSSWALGLLALGAVAARYRRWSP